MDRRDFFKNSAVLALGAALPSHVIAQAGTEPGNTDVSAEKDLPLISSAPVLQNYAENSMGIAFSVSHLANGFVTFSEKPDLSDGKTVMCGGYRVMDVNDKVMLIRLTGLKPATKYY